MTDTRTHDPLPHVADRNAELTDEPVMSRVVEPAATRAIAGGPDASYTSTSPAARAVPPHKPVDAGYGSAPAHAGDDRPRYRADARLAAGVGEAAVARVVAVTGEGLAVLWWRWDPSAGPVVELPGANLPPDPADAPTTAALAAARSGLRMAGWAATGWDHLTELGAVTATAARTAHVYLARGTYPVPATDTGEITPITCRWASAVAMAANGTLEATSAAAVLLADHHRRIHHTWVLPDTAPDDPATTGEHVAARVLYLVQPGEPGPSG